MRFIKLADIANSFILKEYTKLEILQKKVQKL